MEKDRHAVEQAAARRAEALSTTLNSSSNVTSQRSLHVGIQLVEPSRQALPAGALAPQQVQLVMRPAQHDSMAAQITQPRRSVDAPDNERQALLRPAASSNPKTSTGVKFPPFGIFKLYYMNGGQHVFTSRHLSFWHRNVLGC